MPRHANVRLALASERGELEALQRRASLANPGDREALLLNPAAIEIPLEQINDGHVFVLEVARSIQGFAALVPRADGTVDLDALFVEPNSWRQGFGRALVEHCANVARAQGATAVHVVGNPHAEGFYTACGFELLGTKAMRFGIGLLMRRIV